jgi:hypothetical protein
MLDPETLKFIALGGGALCAVSTAPELIVTMVKKKEHVSPWIILRNTTLATGNSAWVVYGTATNQLPIQLFCSISATLTAALALRQLWLRIFTSPPTPKKEDEHGT